MTSLKPTAVSLFSGSGGFDLGVKKNGIDIIWANDIDPFASKAYRNLFPNTEFIESDIHSIKTFPTADILIGCYPCTGFSQAAKRKWKDRDSRDLRANPKNFLFQEFLRAIKIVNPKVIFIENVKGMLSACDGFFFNEQLEGLKELGFDKVHYKTLNASDYGVAQTRERVFIVGIHKSIDFDYKFLENDPIKLTMRDVIGDMPEWPIGEFSETVFHGHFLTRNRKRNWDDQSYTIVANADHVPLHPIGDPMKKVGKDHWVLQGDKNRRLSYKECFKIQGIPLQADFDGPLKAKYMVAGNAVPPKLSENVVKPIISLF